ncbi:F0F1 ATP synthase subunit B [Luteipulveratus halotolerans]|uniref:ATP synthase subunit b n=1 Tax=Luteipulveratus halotolerans TaxID=1631356 RepID=A0A0L6CNU9_9MICO|nr:ATP synthase subunit B [Luteipulveratus halotolerans]
MAARVIAEAGAPGEAGSKPILPYWPELVFGLIAFGIFYWVVKTKVVPKLEQAYAERTAAIEGGMAQAEEAQKQAEAAKSQYEAQLAEARAEAAQIREDARAQGATIIAESREEAGAEATRITDSAHKSIEAERQQAAVSLRSDVGRMSTDLASRIVGESLEDETRQRGIVERFLADLEAGQVTREKASAPQGGATPSAGASPAGTGS